MTSPIERSPRVYTVSELNRQVGDLLAASFPLLWVEGEISNIARPRSGHVYFSLKDDNAQVRCALFRSKARLAGTALDNGLLIRVRARVGLYAARGDYQLICESVEAAGDGALQKAFEALKQKLDAEGLFAEARKKPVPAMPRRIAVVTSATGAAVRDVLHVLARRYALAHVRVVPVPVQGTASADHIVAALAALDRRADCDVILLVRGGGSLEDLQAFNDERVARAIAACQIPAVAGVGHEVDVTIADLVADLRAPTPSAAAECACPDITSLRARLDDQRRRLAEAAGRIRREAGRRLARTSERLERQHPRRRLEASMQRMDRAEQHLRRVTGERLARRSERQKALASRLRRHAPDRRIALARRQVEALSVRLTRAERRTLHDARSRLAGLARALESVSPLHTLDRGYAVAHAADESIVRNAADMRIGDPLRVRLARGQLDCEVRAVSAPDPVEPAHGAQSRRHDD